MLDQVDEENPALISSISVWEVFMLARRGRLALRTDVYHWVRQCELSAKIRFVPVDNEVARISVQLAEPDLEDPADRIIVATALASGAAVVSKDRKIRACEAVRTVW